MNLKFALSITSLALCCAANATPITIGFDAVLDSTYSYATGTFGPIGATVHGQFVIDPQGTPNRHFLLGDSEHLIAVNQSGCATFVNATCTDARSPVSTPTILSVTLTTASGLYSINQNTQLWHGSDIRHSRPVDSTDPQATWEAAFSESSGAIMYDDLGNKTSFSKTFHLRTVGSNENEPGVHGHGNIFNNFYDLSEIIDLNKVAWDSGFGSTPLAADFFFEDQACVTNAAGITNCADTSQSSQSYFSGKLTKLYRIPEPSSAILLLFGGAILLWQRRKAT